MRNFLPFPANLTFLKNNLSVVTTLLMFAITVVRNPMLNIAILDFIEVSELGSLAYFG